MSVFTFIWLMILFPPAVWEAYAIRSKVEGDTLSERTRAWFHTHTRGGRLAFLLAWAALAIWFPIHIVTG